MLRCNITVAVAVAALHLSSASAAGNADDTSFAALADAYYAEFPVAHPTDATELGLHEHDGDLEDWSMTAMSREAARLREWRWGFEGFATKKLSPAHAIDAAELRRSIDAEMLDLERVQRFRHRPARWSRLVTRSVFLLIQRDYAPLETRLRAALSRMDKIPGFLVEAERTLVAVPRISHEIALKEIPGMRSFFTKDVPLAFAASKNTALTSDLQHHVALVDAALGRYEAWIRKQLRTASDKAKDPPFALGEELFRAKLRADQMIEEPTDALLARGEAELRRLQTEFRAVAAKIDPRRPAADVARELGKDHPTPDKAIAETRSRLAGLRKFLVDKRLVTLPSDVIPEVRETPPFMRATSVASMDTPGPFEAPGMRAYYSITLPEPTWKKEQTDEFMENYSRTLVDIVSIHEAFPGHFTQFLWGPRLPSKVRKFSDVSSNSEGWAHYCEQMMLDEGYGRGDPKLRLAQLQDALLRAARFVAAIRMHARGATYDQMVAFFQTEGYQTKAVAEIESRRGTEDPTYLVYTFGKLEILRLRDDYKKKLGASYTLGKFHDAFLGQGAIALPLVRRALLGTP